MNWIAKIGFNLYSRCTVFLMSAIALFGSNSINFIAWSGGTPVSLNLYCVIIDQLFFFKIL